MNLGGKQMLERFVEHIESNPDNRLRSSGLDHKN